MNVKFAYLGRSALRGDGKILSLSPNLSRERVAFDAPLKSPLRFREAISALHDVVISDLRFKKRDKSDYLKWKKEEEERLAAVRKSALKDAKAEVLARAGVAVPAELERQFSRGVKEYWTARQKYSDHLIKHDQELWRMLMPCDPVITVAPDVVFFECFSADESSYGCLTVQRDAFGPSEGIAQGTTNVDYSWDLFDHFQMLRSYRETRFRIDPLGFQVATEGNPEYREEKIDLPPSWLRGFLQIQSAMMMPMRRVTLGREAVYSLCAFMKRHRAWTSPRALRFELLPDRLPRVVMEPWEEPVLSHGAVYQGPPGEPIRVWGRQRLMVLARLLPLVDSVDVYLLGTGLPHFWVVRMGDMTFTLGLSGWTTNDWTRSASLDLLAPAAELRPETLNAVANTLRRERRMGFAEIAASHPEFKPQAVAVALNRLAQTGQAIFDLSAGVFRWRQIMPMTLGEDHIGPENKELVASREYLARGRVNVESKLDAPHGGTLYMGKVDSTKVEMVIDGDGRIRRGQCPCSHHRRSGLRQGPCRHLLALRGAVFREEKPVANPADRWYDFSFLIRGS